MPLGWSSRSSARHQRIGLLFSLLGLLLLFWRPTSSGNQGRMSAPILGLHLRSPSKVMVVVEITHYSSTPDQTDSTPQVTASGTRPKPWTLAVSRDLLPHFPYGSVVELNGQLYVVEDTMHQRWRRRVDIWTPSRAEAIRRGRRTGILILLSPAPAPFHALSADIH